MKLSKVFDGLLRSLLFMFPEIRKGIHFLLLPLFLMWPSLLCIMAAICAYCLGMVDVGDVLMGVFPVVVVLNIVAWFASMFGGP